MQTFLSAQIVWSLRASAIMFRVYNPMADAGPTGLGGAVLSERGVLLARDWIAASCLLPAICSFLQYAFCQWVYHWHC